MVVIYQERTPEQGVVGACVLSVVSGGSKVLHSGNMEGNMHFGDQVCGAGGN